MDMANDRHGTAFVVGAVIGGIVGAAATLWTTPRSGPELRSRMTEQQSRVIELRSRMMGQGDDYAPGAPNIAVSGATGAGGRTERLSSRALGFVERAAAPLVGVRLGETANERGEAVPPSTAATTSVVTTDRTRERGATEEIVLAPGEASGEAAPGDSGPGHVATPDELTSPVPGALDQSVAEQSTSDRFTAFPNRESPPNPPTS
jgi:gas vesicle protein